jgi:transcriptional regulator with XRE-family HTH domain
MSVEPITGWVPTFGDFGQRLAAIRQRQRWNVRAAAAACNVDPESWRNWEQNGREPRGYEAVCKRISLASGCDLVWLMTGTQVPPQREWAPWDSNPQPTDYARRPRHLRAVAA